MTTSCRDNVHRTQQAHAYGSKQTHLFKRALRRNFCRRLWQPMVDGVPRRQVTQILEYIELCVCMYELGSALRAVLARSPKLNALILQ